MANNSQNSPKRKGKSSKIFAGLIGVFCSSTDTWMNVEYVMEAEKAVTSLVVAVPLSSVVAAASLPFMALAWQNRKVFEWFGFLVLFILTASFSFTASLDRSGASRDKISQVRNVKNIALKMAQNGLDSAKQNLIEVKAHINAECEGLYSVIHPKTKNHKPGHGRVCKIWQRGKGLALRDIEKAKKLVLDAGQKITKDSMAIRMASLLPVSVAQVQQYQPMLLPLALQLGGLLFIGFAFAPAPTRLPRRFKTAKNSLAKTQDMTKKEIALAYYYAQIEKGRRKVPLDEIAKLKGVMVHKSTISRWLNSSDLAMS